MKDINFFSVYAKQKNASAGKTLKTVAIFAVVLLLVIGAYAGLTFYKTGLENETARTDTFLMSGEVRDKLAAINTYKYNQSILDQYGQMVDQVLVNLKASDYMNSARMEQISAALPAGITLKSISVTDNMAGMSFTVPTLADAAQLVAALSAQDCFKSVTLVNISGSDTGVYTADLSAELNGGDAQ